MSIALSSVSSSILFESRKIFPYFWMMTFWVSCLDFYWSSLYDCGFRLYLECFNLTRGVALGL